MLGMLIETAIKCPQCDSPVPINGPWEKALCDRCQSVIDIPRDFWESMLVTIFREGRGMKTGVGTESTIFGTFRQTLLYGRYFPYCLKCKTDYVPNAVDPSLGAHGCPECGETVAVTPAPDWLVELVPPLRYFVNAVLSENVGECAASDRPVVFSCPQCGGALKIDGTARMVPCRFCDVDVYLPDDLWLRLHPAKKKERWFAVYDRKSRLRPEDNED